MEANVKHLQHQLLCLFANEVLLQADNFTAAPVSRPSPLDDLSQGTICL